jgi:hypothetical protein
MLGTGNPAPYAGGIPLHRLYLPRHFPTPKPRPHRAGGGASTVRCPDRSFPLQLSEEIIPLAATGCDFLQGANRCRKGCLCLAHKYSVAVPLQRSRIGSPGTSQQDDGVLCAAGLPIKRNPRTLQEGKKIGRQQLVSVGDGKDVRRPHRSPRLEGVQGDSLHLERHFEVRCGNKDAFAGNAVDRVQHTIDELDGSIGHADFVEFRKGQGNPKEALSLLHDLAVLAAHVPCRALDAVEKSSQIAMRYDPVCHKRYGS